MPPHGPRDVMQELPAAPCPCWRSWPIRPGRPAGGARPQQFGCPVRLAGSARPRTGCALHPRGSVRSASEAWSAPPRHTQVRRVSCLRCRGCRRVVPVLPVTTVETPPSLSAHLDSHALTLASSWVARAPGAWPCRVRGSFFGHFPGRQYSGSVYDV